MTDTFSEQYQDLIEDSYDCVDRIVLNAYFPAGQYPAGFRTWWRALEGSDDGLDTAHLMRMAGRFSRRVRAYAQGQSIPVIDCKPGDKKFEIANRYLAKHEGKSGVFLILVSKARCPVWEVVASKAGKIVNIQRKTPMPFVNHYSFHIWDAEWGHITIKMSGHPPFGAQIILNGHEYVACGARRAGLDFRKEGNCFVHTADSAGLAKVADTLSKPETEGRLRNLCDRWIYSSCLVFALDVEEQERSAFHYAYSTYQLEYSRNLRFHSGKQMWEILQRLVDRSRARLDLKVVKTIFGFKNRPSVKRLKQNQWGVEIETPVYDLTVFHVHYGKLSLKIYSKGESVLRMEVMVHNTVETPFGRRLENFPKTVLWMKGVAEQFLNSLHCIECCFIGDETLEGLPEASIVGQTRVGGVDINRSRMRLAMRAAVALATAPKNFTARDLSQKVQALGGPADYGPRQAAYDLKKLRGKLLVNRIGTSHRYQCSTEGLRAMVALVVIRDDVIKPLLAANVRLKSGRRPVKRAPIDAHYASLRHGMRDLFAELGIAA